MIDVTKLSKVNSLVPEDLKEHITDHIIMVYGDEHRFFHYREYFMGILIQKDILYNDLPRELEVTRETTLFMTKNTENGALVVIYCDRNIHVILDGTEKFMITTGEEEIKNIGDVHDIIERTIRAEGEKG